MIDIGRALGLWSGWVNRRAKLIVLVWLALALAGGYYTAGHLTMQTSTEEMLSPDLPFRKLRQEFNAAFPVLDGNVAILVTGATADQAYDAAISGGFTQTGSKRHCLSHLLLNKNSQLTCDRSRFDFRPVNVKRAFVGSPIGVR